VWKKDPIIIIICPLVALMKDQVNRLNNIGFKAAYAGCEDGDFMYVFISPESILLNERLRCMLEKKPYQERLVGIVVDEAHCIVEWGTSSNNKKKTIFRIWYSRLSELRSLAQKGVTFLALTATKKTKQQIFDMLELKKTVEIIDNPDRPNICFVVQQMDNGIKIADHFKFLVDELKQHGRETTRTIIYCQTIKQCALLFNIL
jgi:ATP-dependent DNA helicase RecQ